MSRFSRRQFVVGAAAGAAALSFPIRRVLGANETVNVGFIGPGAQSGISALKQKSIAPVETRHSLKETTQWLENGTR